jgi:voltage-gated potassium channel
MNFREWVNSVSSRTHHSQTLYQLLRASGVLMIIFLIGTIGYYIIGGGQYTMIDCAYMTVITLTTVGYGEIIPIAGHQGAELFTIGLIVLGMGAFLYFVSTMAAFIIEGELLDLLWRRSLDRKISQMSGHFVIAGVGNTGSYVLSEVIGSKRDCVVIDRDEQSVLALFEEVGAEVPFIEGDATDDDTLIKAGIERASGVVFSLGNDRDNLFATISARRLNPKAAIVTRGEDPGAEQKFLMAGATSVIFTNVLGGMRMAAEVLRPEVTTFLDLMMVDHDHYRMVEELPVPADSPLVGKMLRDLGIRPHSDALIIAVWDTEDRDYHFNPGPNYVIPPEAKLIILTLMEDVPLIEHLIRTGEVDPSRRESR